MNQDLHDFGNSLAAGAFLMGVTWLVSHGVPKVKLRARMRAEADAARRRNAAAGIKGNGFSALFLLHRALHLRIRALGWLGGGAVCLLAALLTAHGDWRYWLAWLCALEGCVFRGSYLTAQAAGLSEVAEDAVTYESGGGGDAAMEEEG